MNRVFFLLIAVMVGIPRVGAAELWDYVRVGKNYVAGPRWATRSGKAQVEIRGDRVEIRVGYTDAADGLTRAAALIAGTIQADHTIKARCTFLNTDAIPIQLSGHYFIRDELEIWGEKRKVVTYKEIVFSRSGSIDFWGFLARDVQDE